MIRNEPKERIIYMKKCIQDTTKYRNKKKAFNRKEIWILVKKLEPRVKKYIKNVKFSTILQWKIA